MTRTEIRNTDDLIDLRDVIARVEELREVREASEIPASEYGGPNDDWQSEREELAQLEAFLEECKGNGGDEQWLGDWYPVTAIRDSYFRDYAEDLADDIGAINKDAGWPNSYIDWDAAADALKQDYTSVEFDGTTYWVR